MNSPNQYQEFKREILILVEGKTDESFLRGYIWKIMLELFNRFDFVILEGKDKLRQTLSAICKTPGFESNVRCILIFMDADDSPDDTFRGIVESLKSLNLPSPRVQGCVGRDREKNIGIFFFPDCETSGNLEDLIIKAMKEENEFSCVHEFLRCAKEKGQKLKYGSKSAVYAVLAIQEEPSMDFATAIKRGQIDTNASAFGKIRSFLWQAVHSE